MSGSIYTFASFTRGESLGFRLGGPGLGNLLFPWSRAVVFAKKHNLKRINSTWKTIKLGPIIRGEFDKRFYTDLFQEHEIGGLKKTILLNFAEKIDEKDGEEALATCSLRPRVIVFKGLENSFNPILNDHETVKSELLKIVSTKHKEAANKFEKNGISVHIRMGDFTTPPNEEILRAGKWNYRLPTKWYANVIENIRKSMGKEIRVNIFSDGTDDELREVLKLPNTHRCFYGSAISDLLALSESPVLIASASTFSMWASYLGRMPTIWFPGTHRVKMFKMDESFEDTLDYNQPIDRKLKSEIEKRLLLR